MGGDQGREGGKPSVCIATIHHVRQSFEGELMMDRFLKAMESQSDLPDRILVCDTRPRDAQPDMGRYQRLAGRIQVLSRPMKTLQEGYNFYPSARNALLKACQEEVMIWVDADERLDPDVVRRAREGFSDRSLAAGILCLRPIPRYWGIAAELQYVAGEGHVHARLRIFRTQLLNSLGGFEEGKAEWGTLASKIYPLAQEGRFRISHEKLWACHDSPVRLLSTFSIRLLSHYRHPRRTIIKARALLTAYGLAIITPFLLGRPTVGLAALALPPFVLYLWDLSRCLGAVRRYPDARFRHAFGAALIGAAERFHHAASVAVARPLGQSSGSRKSPGT